MENIQVKFIEATLQEVQDHKDDIENGSIIFVKDTRQILVKLDDDIITMNVDKVEIINNKIYTTDLKMLEKWKAGAKVVLAVRKDREESLMQKFFSNSYYRLMGRFALKDMPKGGFDSFLIDRKVAKIICEMEEKNTTIMGQILWCGFKHEMIYYVRRKREKGKSRWTFSKKVKYFIDSFVSFSYVPIRFASVVGILASLASLVWIVFIVCIKIFVGIDTDGWTTLMAVLLFSSGLILLTLGVIGEYLWRIFDTVRNRPIFIVEETKGLKGDNR